MSEGDLDTRLRYEKGLTELSRILFAEANETDAIQSGLAHLLAAAGADRVYIFENYDDPELGPCYRQTFEVAAEGVKPEIENPDLQRVRQDQELGRWTEVLSRGEPISGFVETFPQIERDILEPQGILSILVLPIRSHHTWYGFLGFDDVRTRREWNDNDITLLRTAAEIIGAFIHRQQYMKQIEHLIKEKELLLREVHHRIKNNMNTIISLLSLQASAAEDARSEEVLKETMGRIQGMLLIYDKLYRSSDYSSMDIDEYLSSLVDDIAAIFSIKKRINVTKKIEKFPVDVKKLYPLGIIVNELLTNALKYAFPEDEKGTIEIEARKNGISMEIIVRDDGIGLPEDFNMSDSSGFGLDLVQILTDQIEGSLSYSGKQGTAFTITAPLD